MQDAARTARPTAGDRVMIDIRIDGLDRMRNQLGELSRQMPFIASKALNDVGFAVRDALVAEMVGTFDAVKPWTLRQIHIEKSTKQNLAVEIGPKSIIKERKLGKIGHVLAPHIFGGQRVNRKAERKLQAMGLMPSGFMAVPAGVKLDGFGNITKATWAKFAELQRYSKLFVALSGKPRVAHLAPGIYERMGNGKRVRALVLFVARANYRKRLNWEPRARDAVSRSFPSAFSRAVEYAIRTTRR